MGNLNFDTTEVAPKNMDFEPLPKGRYRARMVGSEVKVTKDQLGLYLAMEFDVTEPGFEGRKVFSNLNIKNKSEKAEQIAKGLLSALCKACGKVGIVDDSTDLHDIEVVLKLDVGKADGDYAAKNEIKGFYPVDKGAPQIAKAPAAVAPTKTKAPTPIEDDEVPF